MRLGHNNLHESRFALLIEGWLARKIPVFLRKLYGSILNNT